MNLSKSALSVLVFAAAVSVSSQADDAPLNFPGANCVRTSGGSATYATARIGNSSTASTMNIDCPIQMNDVDNTASGKVVVVDRHSSEAIECTLHDILLIAGDPSVYGYTESDASTGSSANHQNLTYGFMATDTDSYKFYGCTVPIRYSGNTSYVASYSITDVF